MIGPLAHELEAVAPEAVMENEDGYLVVDAMKLNELVELYNHYV